MLAVFHFKTNAWLTTDYRLWRTMGQFTMPTSRKQTHFRTTQQFTVEYSPHAFTEYVSARTGMRVVVVDQKGPKVFGTFAAATEILDDSGSPHTLEHLCFMGSRKYPYRGILDQLATRAYSSLNAWTATDHTAYTLETAGYAAFAQILPIYLDHIVLPTLTDSACYTEVFHIDPTGHDAGVVYSEMQGLQNNQLELMELESKRILYAEGIGFRYETGGMMEQLRVLTADRIRKFHRDMYQPKNLCLIIIGEVEHQHLLDTLDTFEDTILDSIPGVNDSFKRPWTQSKQPSPLSDTTIKSIEFPEEDESVGEISIKYFGPSCNDVIQCKRSRDSQSSIPNAFTVTAMNVLLAYLASSSASVLENVLVEKEQRCTAVYYSISSRPNSVIDLALSGVTTSDLQATTDRLFELLDEVAGKELDMVYLLDCLDRERRQQMFSAESSDQYYTTPLISTFLFSEDRNLRGLASLENFKALSKWTEYQWREFMKKWISDAHKVVILGKPSKTLSKRLKKDEISRVEQQKERLGEKGLKDLEEKLKQAKEDNDRPIPSDLFKDFKVPSTDTIHFVNTIPARSGRARDIGTFNNDIQKTIDRDNFGTPLFIHYENISSNFVHIYLLLGTESIPVKLRPLLPIYLENFFTSPLIRDGKRIEFEDVIKALDRDTVGYEMSSAARFGSGEVLSIALQVEVGKYDLAIQWIRDLLWKSPFDIDRLKSITSKLLQNVPEEKRSGDDMVEAVTTMVQEKPESISRASQPLVKAVYLKRVKKVLKTEPKIITDGFEELRRSLCEVNNMRVLVISDIQKLKNPAKAWQALTEGQDFSKPLTKLDQRIERLTDIGRDPGNHAYIVPMATIDSSFATAVAKGPTNPRDPLVPALMVAIAYLDAMSGPLWTSVRGTGLAYGAGFRRRPGQIEFSIYRSPDSFKALSASKKAILECISGEHKLDDLAIEGAVSSIVLAIADGQSTMASAAVDNIVKSVMRDLPRNWNDIILEKVRNVSKEEMVAVMKDILLPVFQPETSNLFITCATIMEKVSSSSYLCYRGFDAYVKVESCTES